MKKNIFALAAILILHVGVAQKELTYVIGTWQGTITTAAGDLGLAFKIKSSGNALSTKMDVPAQMAKDIPASATKSRNDSLLIEFGMLRAKFRGRKTGDTNVISGNWEQNGAVYTLTLKRSDQVPVIVKRSQEPTKPYAYNEEEISFPNENAKIKLAGTFTYPKNKINCPAVILITGSGPQNRNEEILGHQSFMVLADYLSNRGIAVLRFDDRGVGESSGNFADATSADFASDVEAAMRYLKTRKEINTKSIGLLGHSEGGLIAPMVAARSKETAFIILLAGPGLRGSDLLALQSEALSRASGMDETQIKSNKELNLKLYAMALSKSSDASDSIAKYLINAGLSEQVAQTQASQLMAPWLQYFLAFDPATSLSKTHCPVLAINGKKDLQVPYQENLEAIALNLKKAGNKKVTVKAYDDLNHLFQHCKTGLPKEYGEIDETISPEVLADVSAWILANQ